MLLTVATHTARNSRPCPTSTNSGCRRPVGVPALAPASALAIPVPPTTFAAPLPPGPPLVSAGPVESAARGFPVAALDVDVASPDELPHPSAIDPRSGAACIPPMFTD